MRLSKLIILLLFLNSCQKEKLEIGEDFDRIIGKWSSINGDDKTNVSISESGCIKIVRSTERSEKFAISELIKYNDALLNETYWTKCLLMNKSNTERLKFFLNTTADTAIFTIGIYSENQTYNYYHHQFFVRDEN
jgi:hypothetical protein